MGMKGRSDEKAVPAKFYTAIAHPSPLLRSIPSNPLPSLRLIYPSGPSLPLSAEIEFDALQT